jgi:hypothetical protein
VDFQNVIFISAELKSLDKNANLERTALLRDELLKNGYSFELVKVNGSSSFMVVTNQLEQMISLAKKLKQDSIVISDRQRTTFVVTIADKKPTKLGKLCRVTKETAADLERSGGFFLIVTDNQVPYYYSAS